MLQVSEPLSMSDMSFGDILPFEQAAAQYPIPTADVPESDGEVPLAMQGISDFLTVRQCHIAANATLFQIIEQDFVVQWLNAYIHEAILHQVWCRNIFLSDGKLFPEQYHPMIPK